MNTLSKKAKGAIIGSVAGLGALAIGIGIWQPWKKPEVEETKPPAEQQTQTPEQEEQLTLNVGAEKIPCTLYEGDGWSIYVPEGWTVDANKNGGIFYAPGEDQNRAVQVEVIHDTAASYEGNFVSVSPVSLSDSERGRQRRFYTGTEEESWELVCQSSAEEWSANEKLLTALARTFAVGEECPFAGVPLAYEPDWQVAEGKTVLWLDKNGYVVNDAAEKAVREEMLSWDRETQRNFSGEYRLEDLRWAGGYCQGSGKYIDVFEANVWYKMVPGGEDEITMAGGMSARDGWLTYGPWLNVALTHDGSDVSEEKAMWCNDTSAGMPLFLADLQNQEISAAPAEPSTETFAYGDLELEVTNVTGVKTKIFTDDGGTEMEQMVFTCLPGATVTVVDADMSQPIVEGLGTAHPNWGVERNGKMSLRDGMEPFEVPAEGCKIYNMESSVYVLLIEMAE